MDIEISMFPEKNPEIGIYISLSIGNNGLIVSEEYGHEDDI